MYDMQARLSMVQIVHAHLNTLLPRSIQLLSLSTFPTAHLPKLSSATSRACKALFVTSLHPSQ